MGRTWPDAPMPGTSIVASHVSTLRQFIDEDIARALPPMTPQAWTWGNISPGSPIQARYFVEMRAAIQRLWNNKGRGPLPDWTSGVTPAGTSTGVSAANATLIRASDVVDIRVWLNQYEDNHPTVGMDSKSYDPSTGALPLIGAGWVDDVVSVSAKNRLVRCNIVARSGPQGTIDLSTEDRAR